MKNKLKKELRKLSTDILTADDLDDIAGLYEKSRSLYEKLAVLKFIEVELNDMEVNVSKNAIAAKFEELANAVLDSNKSVPENNPHEEDIMIPGMDTIKDMVSEMPSNGELEDVLADFMSKPNYMKNDKELFMPSNEDLQKKELAPKSLNDRLGKSNVKVDLNDRLAFVKHLFNNNMEDYNRVLSQLNTIDTEERSIAFIQNMVKPDYNNWEGKEPFEERFLELVSRRFA
ncbi:hypothetical protein SAMN04488009_2684 [Maribacter sedimenticola]|uniref:Uncharacterized protein n=1 Tax=Maribacter sedimenticola TaxID=228956 RepID=A0ABY1SIS0_9FLAO|nr:MULTISPECIES: hypothetical protein [Maribacter]TVZ16017.1 hypothetical protein JM81_2270 [Maribacter sp. MAR_2009_72]SNR59086.1 hypothetical protein SAMN04488009_2684 [Maribacter sedimenticola]